ncbi:replication protein A 70 kDa DNA-binding subunit-like [Pyrus ussuriensis x Pyrus communis]|uniref:Replication protein A 70 kDa DNA-binding subunit-like n=1 Tax=Pyrus ussuriensis x Pyrus communis TaxID=2448454 RepID=A0A5N5IE33_9ROSA|nr:replication protein A 70 kDa DNA-binding subunit-like [Pyrus ussuriensis x Pyrus communis]
MNIDPIRSLLPFQFNKKIRVRVCRIWRPNVIEKDNTFGGLQCILVDEMKDAIQATMKEMDSEYVASKIKSNHVYEITHFSTSCCKPTYKIVPHDLCFNTKTKFEQLPSVHPQIPSHQFYLLDYSQLSYRIDRYDILTYVMGRITTVKPLKDKMIGNERIEKICELKLQNIKKENVNLTLWGDTATFDFKALEHLTPLVLGVFASLKVKLFRENIVLNNSISTMIFINPDIPEVAPYKTRFKVTLILEDASDETSAIIIGKQAEHLFGTSCFDLVIEKGFTDQQELLDAILQGRGQIKIFQLQFRNLKNDFNKNDFLIQAILTTKYKLFNQENMAAQNFSSTPLLFEKKLKHLSSTISPTIVTSPTKSSVWKEIDEQNTSDTEDFSIKSLKNKASPIKFEMVFTASKTEYVTSVCY